MKSPDTESNVKFTGPIVKIAWVWHNRAYELGIQAFLKELGVEVSDEEIKTTIRKILSSQ